jgi:2-dehydropantoate 2-reductase
MTCMICFDPTTVNRADSLRVVKSQSEAFADDTHYAFCLVTTKCLPDVNPTPKLLADAIASGKVGAWALIQVSPGLHMLPLDTCNSTVL